LRAEDFVRPALLRARLRVVAPRLLRLVLAARLPERPLDVDRLARDWDFLLAICSLSSLILRMGTRTARGENSLQNRAPRKRSAATPRRRSQRCAPRWGAGAKLRAPELEEEEPADD
jgi:hypothetical protein